jgi:hypothetical protein
MKRLLLSILSFVITISVFAQPNFAKITGPEKDVKVRQVQVTPDQASPYSVDNTIGSKFFNNTIIGTSWYDLQSYTNVMQRIWAYPDGTIGATWMSRGHDGVPERGAGYNYFDGNEWGTPNPHVGPSDRMGWPSYAPWGPNGEIIALYRYVTGAGTINFYKRENKGQGDWTEVVLTGPEGISLVWQSMITSGENHEYIHLLAYTYDAEYQGQTNALLYYRSSDGAETWEVNGIIIDGLGVDYYPTIPSLTYAWANPVGNTIAFTFGFDELGGKVFKSYDNGDNWEYIQVMETTLDPYNIPTDSERIPCGSGTSACVLDSQGNAHIVFPRMGKIYTAGELFFYPYTDGLIYWNESMPLIDTTLISSYTLEFLYDAGNLCGQVMTLQPTIDIPEDQPNYANALCAYPQLSIDADDNIFVVSSTLAPDYNNGTFLFRHIIANSTFDLGASWEGQIDLNEDIQYIFSECAYPVMPPVIGDYIHVVFQEDPSPGIFEWLENHTANDNNLMHMELDKDVFVGLKEPHKDLPLRYTVSPNPADEATNLNIYLERPGDISLKLISQVGQSVYNTDLARYDAGRHNIRLDVSDLPAGIYYCVVNYDGQQVAKKLIVF